MNKIISLIEKFKEITSIIATIIEIVNSVIEVLSDELKGGNN